MVPVKLLTVSSRAYKHTSSVTPNAGRKGLCCTGLVPSPNSIIGYLTSSSSMDEAGGGRARCKGRKQGRKEMSATKRSLVYISHLDSNRVPLGKK